jgi:hypothetical protein
MQCFIRRFRRFADDDRVSIPLCPAVYTLYGHNDSGLPRSEFPFCLFEQGQTAHFSRESAMFALALLTVQVCYQEPLHT